MKIDWQVLSFAINIVLMAIIGLSVRWLGGVVRNLEQQITIAVQHLQIELQRDYATKADLRDGLNIVGKLESGFEDVKLTIRTTPPLCPVAERVRSDPPSRT